MELEDEFTYPTVTITAEILTRRKHVIGIEGPDGERMWIPKTMISDMVEIPPYIQVYKLEIPEWFAKREKLI